MSEPVPQYPRESLREWWRERTNGIPPEEEQIRLIGNLVDILFFASLAREEGWPALARIVYHEDGIQGLERTREHADFDSLQGPALAWAVIPLKPIPLSVKSLVKLTPAARVERTAIIVGPHEEQLRILGLARRNKSTDGGRVLVLSAPEPGFVVLHLAGEEIFRYERGQRLSPEQKFSLWKILHADGLVRQTIETICQNLVQALTKASFFQWSNHGVSSLLFDLINTMVSTRSGGLIAILPEDQAKTPFYLLSNHQSRFSELLLQSTTAQTHATRLAFDRLPENRSKSEEERDADESAQSAQEALSSLIENIGQLTALDNALLLGPDLKVIGAGFAVPTPDEITPTVHVARDLQGAPGPVYDIDQHGSRHRAAAWFAAKNPGGLVFLVSHDGPVRCLICPAEGKETLLWNLRLFEI